MTGFAAASGVLSGCALALLYDLSRWRRSIHSLVAAAQAEARRRRAISASAPAERRGGGAVEPEGRGGVSAERRRQLVEPTLRLHRVHCNVYAFSFSHLVC